MGRGFGGDWRIILRFSGAHLKSQQHHLSGNLDLIPETSVGRNYFYFFPPCVDRAINRSILNQSAFACWRGVQPCACNCFWHGKLLNYCTDSMPNLNKSTDEGRNQASVGVTKHDLVDDDLQSLPQTSLNEAEGNQWGQGFREIIENNKTEREKFISKMHDGLFNASDTEEITQILDSEASMLNISDNPVFLELVNSLESKPQLALEAFHWKRRQSDISISPEEYSKSIVLAGRAKNIDLALELFSESESRGTKRVTSMYNALMTASICNGLTKKALSVFEDLKRDAKCNPTIVTFNILLSTFGRSMLVDHMEMVNRAIQDSGLSPTVHTYNTLIAGYVTAWMWDEMENTFKKMEGSSVKPNHATYSLMVRGYAHSGQVKEMEEAFEHVREQISQKEVPLIRAMIWAYFKSKEADKVAKIENLMQFISEEEYRPWLDAILIRLYAQADAVEGMENSITRALERNTIITTVSVVRSVVTTYFRCNAIDRLEAFVKQVRTSGWKLCRSLYHGRMVMYGFQNRMNEMESVLEEMRSSSHFRPTKKTFLILYKAYLKFGKEAEVKWTLRRMDEAGFILPLDAEIFLH